MIIFATMKCKNIVFQIKSLGFKYVAASGFSFPPSPIRLSVKNFFLNADRRNRFVKGYPPSGCLICIPPQ